MLEFFYIEWKYITQILSDSKGFLFSSIAFVVGAELISCAALCKTRYEFLLLKKRYGWQQIAQCTLFYATIPTLAFLISVYLERVLHLFDFILSLGFSLFAIHYASLALLLALTISILLRERSVSLIRLKVSSLSVCTLVVGAAFITLLFGRFLIVSADPVGASSDGPRIGFDMFLYSSSAYIVVICLHSLVRSCVEEVVFRGVFLKYFTERFGMIIGVFVSALMFALSHGDLTLYKFLALLLSGTVYAALSLYYKSLLPSMIIHSLFNLIYTLKSVGL